MRIFTGILLLASFPLHLLSGAGAILQAKAEAFLAKEDQMVKSGDLSSVSGDLVDEETLKKVARKDPSAEAVDPSGATWLWTFGVVLLMLAVAQLVAGVQVLRDRVSATVVVIVLLALVVRVVGLALDGLSIIGAGQAALLALALVFAWRSRARPAPTITT